MVYPKVDIISGEFRSKNEQQVSTHVHHQMPELIHHNNHIIIQLSIPPNECKNQTTISSILYTLRSYLFFSSPERFISLYFWVLSPQIITREHAACYMTMYVVPVCSGPAPLCPPSTLNKVRHGSNA